MTEVKERQNGYYEINGEQYPSVTTILQVIAKPGLVKWAGKIVAEALKENPALSVEEAVASINLTKNMAAGKGSQVHQLLADEEQYFPVDLQGYQKAYKAWERENAMYRMYREIIVWSDEYKYAGTADLIAAAPDHSIWLIDIKTGNIYREHGLQLAAYAQAVSECLGIDVGHTGLLKLNADGSYEFKETHESLITFLHAKKLWEWWSKPDEKKTRWVAVEDQYGFSTFKEVRDE